jgi:transcriptional regulator with XRE-family HTH domain
MVHLINVFAKNLKILRKNAGLSQEELAYRAGLHRTYIGAVERCERNITLKNVERIAMALNVDPVILLTESKDRENS